MLVDPLMTTIQKKYVRTARALSEAVGAFTSAIGKIMDADAEALAQVVRISANPPEPLKP